MREQLLLLAVLCEVEFVHSGLFLVCGRFELVGIDCFWFFGDSNFSIHACLVFENSVPLLSG